MDETDHRQNNSPKCVTSRRTLLLAVLVLAIACLAFKYGFMLSSSVANKHRDLEALAASGAKWAAKLDVPGLPNLHKVSDTLFRGAQPTEQGIKRMPELGIKTIVNLRLLHSDRKLAAQLNLNYQHIPVETWDPDSPEIVRFLKIVTDPSLAPVFVHCKHGADRTGTMCAIYRIVVEGWTKEQAIAEMTKGGFNFHSTWKNLVKCVNDLDVSDIKRRADLAE